MLKTLSAAVLALALAVPAQAGTLVGISMPDQVTVSGETLQLNGMALRKKLVFKVYVGGLYLPSLQKNAAKVLSTDAPRHMVMEWLRDVDKDSICGGWYEGLEANTPNASADLKKDFDKLCSWMSEVEEGDQFTFTYLPGEGTTVKVKGKTMGTLPGKEFADALFASWIGPNPGPGEDFRKALMGG